MAIKWNDNRHNRTFCSISPLSVIKFSIFVLLVPEYVINISKNNGIGSTVVSALTAPTAFFGNSNSIYYDIRHNQHNNQMERGDKIFNYKENKRKRLWRKNGGEAGHGSLLSMCSQKQHVCVSMMRTMNDRVTPRSYDYYGISRHSSWIHPTHHHGLQNYQKSRHRYPSGTAMTITQAYATTDNNGENDQQLESPRPEQYAMLNESETNDSNPNENFFEEYVKTMEDVLQSRRVTQGNKKMTDDDNAKVSTFLLSPVPSISLSTTTSSNEEGTLQETMTHLPSSFSSLKQHLNAKQKDFKTHTNMTDAQLQMAAKALNYIGDFCAKHQYPKPLFTAWNKIKESGIILQEKTLSTYLYVLSSSTSTSNNNNDTCLSNDILDDVATTHDLLYQPTEKTISLRVKNLVSRGNAKEAEAILTKFYNTCLPNHIDNMSQNSQEAIGNQEKIIDDGIDETNQNTTMTQKQVKLARKKQDSVGQVKLRTFSPVLELYCQQGDISSALKLYKLMKCSPSVLLDAEIYATLISAVAENGYFTVDSPPIEGASELGYENDCSSGPPLFDRLISELADNVLEIGEKSANQIRNSFARGFKKHHRGDGKINLEEVPSDCRMIPIPTSKLPEEDDTLVVCRVSVDQKTALCPRTNAKLRLLQLQKEERKHVHETLLKMADTQYEAYDAKLEAKQNKSKRQESDGGNDKNQNSVMAEKVYAGEELKRFADWLDEREGDHFTAIVDGANVAYYGLGKVNFYQVKMMVKALEYMGENPLVVLPQKYCQEKFYIRQGYVQKLSNEELEIVNNLTETDQLYVVPHRCLDDYYWMLASVSNQTMARKGMELNIQPDNEQGRWPGLRPMLITNDRMRDHKLELLEPRLFRRWYSSHIIKYDFSPFVNERSEQRDITFATPDFFSREIQGNPDGRTKKMKLPNTAWHIPVSDWDDNDRLCIRIPR